HFQYPTLTSFFHFFFQCCRDLRDLHSFPTRRSSDLPVQRGGSGEAAAGAELHEPVQPSRARSAGRALRALDRARRAAGGGWPDRSEEHTSELQSRFDLVCRLLLEKKKKVTELVREIKSALAAHDAIQLLVFDEIYSNVWD